MQSSNMDLEYNSTNCLLRYTRFEKLKRIHLSLDPFSVAENTLTPTLKLRRWGRPWLSDLSGWRMLTLSNPPPCRMDAYTKHKAALDALYELPEPSRPESGSKL